MKHPYNMGYLIGGTVGLLSDIVLDILALLAIIQNREEMGVPLCAILLIFFAIGVGSCVSAAKSFYRHRNDY